MLCVGREGVNESDFSRDMERSVQLPDARDIRLTVQ